MPGVTFYRRHDEIALYLLRIRVVSEWGVLRRDNGSDSASSRPHACAPASSCLGAHPAFGRRRPSVHGTGGRGFESSLARHLRSMPPACDVATTDRSPCRPAVDAARAGAVRGTGPACGADVSGRRSPSRCDTESTGEWVRTNSRNSSCAKSAFSGALMTSRRSSSGSEKKKLRVRAGLQVSLSARLSTHASPFRVVRSRAVGGPAGEAIVLSSAAGARAVTDPRWPYRPPGLRDLARMP